MTSIPTRVFQGEEVFYWDGDHMSIMLSLHELRFHFWANSPSGWGSSWSDHVKIIYQPESQLKVNWGLGGGEMSFNISSMFKRGLFNITNAYLEEFEVRSKVSKNGKWPVIESFQKWQVFGPHSTWLSNIKASNEFLVNIKVEDLYLSFSKSPRSWASDKWLRRYGQIISKCAWNFKRP